VTKGNGRRRYRSHTRISPSIDS